jgi:hypothetical protein
VEDDDPATQPQINYMNDLISGTEYQVLPSHRTKSYVSKVIEMLKNDPEGEFPEFSRSYKVQDSLPMGHGEKSLYMINRWIALTDAEALAIRWHLGMSDTGAHFFYPSGAPIQQATKEHKLVPMLISADYLATWFIDVTV